MATEKDFKIKNGLILNNDNSGARISRSGNYLKNTTQHGYIQFGPNNTGHAHIDTDRSQFYFNKKLIVDEGVVSSYNEDLVLKRASGTTNQLTIGTSAATFAGNLVVTGNLTVNGSTVTNSATNTTIEDALIELGSGNTGTNSNDLGLILERGTTGNNVFIGWDESEDKVAFGTTTATGSSTGNISYSRASILANALDLTNHIDIADNGKIRLGAGDDLQLHHDGTNSFMINYTGDLTIRNGATDKDIIFQSDDGSGSETTYFLLDGSTAKTQFNRHLKIIDNMQIQVGTNPDMLIYHDGTDSIITNATGDLLITSTGDDVVIQGADDVDIKVQGGEMAAKFGGNGGVDLYHNNSKKFETTSGGVSVTGTVDATGTITSSNGTVTNVMSFSDRGIFGTTSNHPVELRANGSQAIRIDTSQQVGFGTSSPEEKIEVAGNVRMQSPISTTTARPAATVATLTSGEIRAKNSDGSDGGLLRLSAGAGTTQNTMSYIDLQGYSTAETNNGKHIIFGTGGADRMEITESGNVGIGTATPSEKLSVAPDTDVSAEIGRAHIGAVGHSDYAAFSHVDRNTTGNFALMQHGSGETYLNASSGQNINFRINNSATMLLNATGLGIGTTSPDTKLDVNGDITMTANIVHKGDSNTYFGFHGNDLWRVVTGGQERFEVSNSGFRFNEHGHDMDFTVESNNSGSMLFVDGGNDRVGIGTGSPAETLEVGGTMKVGNMKFQNAAGGRLGFNRNTGTGAIYDSSYGAYQFQNNQSGYFEIQVYDSSGTHITAHSFTTTGRFGVGTTSPTNRLSVSGNMNVTGTSTMGDSSSDSLVFTGLLKQGLSGGTTVMDASRNMSNIGTISSGAITSTGTSLFETANSQHTGSTVNETLWEITDWDTTESLRQKLNTTSSNFTKVDDDTAPAGGVFQVVSNNNVYPNKFYPISDETYIIFEAWVKHESGSDNSGNFYAGSTFYNGSQVSFGNVNRYWGSGGDAQDSDNTTWRHIRGVLNGESLRNTTGTIDAEYMKLLFLFNYNASGNTSRYCGVRFYHSRKAVTHLLHVTQTQGDRNFRDTYDDISSAAVVLDGSRNLLNLESIDLADSKELKIGSGDDLKLFHDGSHSFVHHNGTGALKLKEGSADAVVIDGGVVNLNHSGTTKLSTTSTGVTVTGATTISGATDEILTLNSTDDGAVYMSFERSNDRHAYVGFGSGNDTFMIVNEESDGDIIFKGNDGGSTITALTLDMSNAGQANFNNDVRAGGDLRLTGGSGNVRSDNIFQFLRHSDGGAQNIRTKSVFAGSTYGDTPPAGSVNATNTYELNGTTVIDSSRNLTNIGTYSGSGNITVSGASSPTFTLQDTTNNVYFKAYAQDSNAFVGTTSSHNLNIGTNNTTAININNSQGVTISKGLDVYGTSPAIKSRGSDSEIILQSLNESASNSAQFHIAHQLGNVQIYNARGNMRYYMGSNSATYIEGDGSYAEVNTAYGYTRIGAANASYSHFYTDRATFYFDKQLNVNGDIRPHSTDTRSLGNTSLRWNNGYIREVIFNSTGGAVGSIGQAGSGGDVEINSDHYIYFKESDADTTKAIWGLNDPYFTFGQTTLNTSYRMYVNGSFAATADVTAYASDERLKTNILEIDNPIEKVKQLRGVTFDWIDDVEDKGFEPSAKHETGVIAQEVQKVIPDAVVPAPFDSDYLTVKHEKIVPLLIEAIKEQQKEIEQLKKHSHPAKDMCDMNGYEELVARIEKMEKNYGNN